MVISLVYGELHDMSADYLSIGPIGVNIITFSLIPLLLALAGMKPVSQWGRWETVLNILYRGVFPVVLYSMRLYYLHVYLCNRVPNFDMENKYKHETIRYDRAPFAGLVIFLCTRTDHLLLRWREFMNPSAKEMWYMGNNADAIQARVGLDKVLVKPPKIPYVLYDNVFPYLIYCFGWLFGVWLAY